MFFVLPVCITKILQKALGLILSIPTLENNLYTLQDGKGFREHIGLQKKFVLY